MRLYNPETYKRVEVEDKGNNVKKALEAGLVPSVTNILDIINEGPFLTKWKIENSVKHYIETGDYKAAINFDDQTASSFGTVCHNLLESYALGTKCEDQYTHIHEKTIEPMKIWIDKNVKKVLFMEYFFVDEEEGYGGTADMLLELNNGILLLGDLKVKKDGEDLRHIPKVGIDFRMHPSLSYKLQLSAYRKHFEKSYGKLEIGNFLLASPFENKRKKDGIINNIIINKPPRLEPFLYFGQDWYPQFDNVYNVWKALHGTN